MKVLKKVSNKFAQLSFALIGDKNANKNPIIIDFLLDFLLNYKIFPLTYILLYLF
jgi:hypothetical protein